MTAPRIVKRNGKVKVVSGDRTVYCPPFFIRLTARTDLEPIRAEYEATGEVSIDTIWAFEKAMFKPKGIYHA